MAAQIHPKECHEPHLTTKLQPGTPAPDFTLPDAEGKQTSLADYRGKNVIVYFYPKRPPPAAPPRPATSATAWPPSRAPATRSWASPPTPPEKLADFTGDFALTFPLLSDEDHAVALAYGAWGEKLVDGEILEGIVRSTVVLDPDGKVTLAQYQVKAAGPRAGAEGGARDLRFSLNPRARARI